MPATQTEDATAPDGAVGHRVAVARKLAGLTQQQLADRAHVSTSLVSQVERGVVPASPAFTAAVARALRTDVDALTGEPYGPALPDPQAEHAGIPALRAALDCDEDPDLDGYPMPPAELRARLDECDQDRQKSRYGQMLAVLPGLLQHAYLIADNAAPGHDAETAWALLDDAYVCAHSVAVRLGYYDLASLVNERSRHAAERSGDPLRVATSAEQRSSRSLNRGDYARALRIMERAQAEITAEHSPAADAVRIHLHLRQSVAHARSGALDRADEHISTARELVNHGLPVHPYYNVQATKANINFHWVRTPVEVSDGTAAVTRAEQVKIPGNATPTRAGRHWIDIARAWTLHGDHPKALGALNQARRIAPQKTRYSSDVHETVHILAETERRATDTLAAFARWIGVTL